MRVSVACSAEVGAADEVATEVADGATVLDAIRASGLLERFAALDVSSCATGIWGRPAALTSALTEGDRVEIYRPLLVDPKEARRLRATRTPRKR